MELYKIVITGGPCAGKSSAFLWLKRALSEKGYTVLCVPETATEFIMGGVAPWTCGTNIDFQKCQMELQLTKERLFLRAAQSMKDEKIIIICDRGALDNKIYMNDEDFKEVLSFLNVNEEKLMDSYDAVFHLVTAANGASDFYTTENNAARTETVDEAVALDYKLIDAWKNHKNFFVIDNSTNFENKMKRLINIIFEYLHIENA